MRIQSRKASKFSVPENMQNNSNVFPENVKGNIVLWVDDLQFTWQLYACFSCSTRRSTCHHESICMTLCRASCATRNPCYANTPPHSRRRVVPEHSSAVHAPTPADRRCPDCRSPVGWFYSSMNWHSHCSTACRRRWRARPGWARPVGAPEQDLVHQPVKPVRPIRSLVRNTRAPASTGTPVHIGPLSASSLSK